MKTILIAHNYSKKSFSYMSLGAANHLSLKGFRVVFLSHRPYFEQTKRVINENGELIITSWSSKKRPTSIQDLIYFTKVYKKYRPDYILGHFAGANISILASKILSLGKVRTFAYYHTLSGAISKDLKSSFTYRLKRLRKTMFYNIFVDTVICPSDLSKEDIVRVYKRKSSKTRIILNAIEDRKKKKPTASPKSNRIAYLGRLDPTKNVILLLNSFIEFKRQHSNSSLKLCIAGSGKEGEEIKAICDKFSFLEFIGLLNYEEVDSYLSSCDYTIIPSFSDNLPTVGIESLMNSTPIIISENTGLSEYCTNNIDSIVFNPDKETLIKIFEKISNDSYNDMALEARNLFERKFSIEQYCQEIEALLINN